VDLALSQEFRNTVRPPLPPHPGARPSRERVSGDEWPGGTRESGVYTCSSNAKIT
jgi:hypothetical protein